MPDFNFVERTGPAAEARLELSGSSYWVNDQAYVRAFGAALQPHVADLVSIALSCYAADRLTRRPMGWGREFRIHLAVSEPDRWAKAKVDLCTYLAELTDDRWDFDFESGRPARLSEQQVTLFPIKPDPSGSVALFSGGLDSLTGAVHHLVTYPGRLVLLGARSSTVIGRDQRRLAAELRGRFGSRVIDIGIPLRLRHAYSAEATQRTRGFLFLALATGAALASGSHQVVVFENGYGAHNPRLGEQQWGAQATRSTHPFVLGLFERFARCAAMPVSIELPHRFRTKAELIRLMPEELHPLIAMTASCDGYPLRQANHAQCGRCGSCVLRQQSLASAGISDADRNDYAYRPLSRPQDLDPITILMARQAWLMGKLANIQSWDEIALQWPSLTLGLDDSPWPERASVLRLMTTVAAEWTALESKIPFLKAHVGRSVDAAAIA